MATPLSEETVDALMHDARAKALAIVAASEHRFVESVMGRGAMTLAQAHQLLKEQRETVLEELDEQMRRLKAWMLRGCTDLN